MTTMKTGSRVCSRCGKDLTDAASMECGVGPICRKLDNALLAQMIPANVDAAKAAYGNVSMGDLPVDCHLTFATVDGDLLADTNDWRATVKRIEWMLSHEMTPTNRTAMYDTVLALGYVGLVAMWKGEAASGKAVVAFEDGRLWFKGPRNSAGKDALKAIPGRMFHPKTPETAAAWSVPAKGADAFFKAIATHWPNHEGLADAVAAAKSAVASGAVAAAPAVVKTSAPMLTVEGESVIVKAPYNADFVAKVKALPYKDRAWNGVNKTWTVKLVHKAAVEKMLADCYGKAAA